MKKAPGLAETISGPQWGPELGLPILELGNKVLASDPNAGAQNVGAQNLGAQSSGYLFRTWEIRY